MKNSFIHILVFSLISFACNNFIHGNCSEKLIFENSNFTTVTTPSAQKQKNYNLILRETDLSSFDSEDDLYEKNNIDPALTHISSFFTDTKNNAISYSQNNFSDRSFITSQKQFILTFSLRI